MIVVSCMISIFCPLVFVRIASSGTPPPSIREYCPAGSIMVEEVLLAVRGQVGHDKPSFASTRQWSCSLRGASCSSSDREQSFYQGHICLFLQLGSLYPVFWHLYLVRHKCFACPHKQQESVHSPEAVNGSAHGTPAAAGGCGGSRYCGRGNRWDWFTYWEQGLRSGGKQPTLEARGLCGFRDPE